MSQALTLLENTAKIEVTPNRSPSLVISAGANHMTITPTVGDIVAVSQPAHTLTISERIAETLTILDSGNQSLIISANEGPVYGHPYFEAGDGMFQYFSWQHQDGTRWRAQRYDDVSQEIKTRLGANPQPQTLAEFQTLSYT